MKLTNAQVEELKRLREKEKSSAELTDSESYRLRTLAGLEEKVKAEEAAREQLRKAPEKATKKPASSGGD